MDHFSKFLEPSAPKFGPLINLGHPFRSVNPLPKLSPGIYLRMYVCIYVFIGVCMLVGLCILHAFLGACVEMFINVYKYVFME